MSQAAPPREAEARAEVGPLDVVLNPGLVLRTGLVVIAVLAVGNGAAVALQDEVPGGFDSVVRRWWYLDQEANVPTFVNFTLLWLAAAVMAVVAAVERRLPPGRGWRAWALLAAVFAFLAFDEVMSLHERLILSVRARLGLGEGLLAFAWIIPYSIVAALLGAALIPFLRRLPRATRGRLLLAGALYLTGALVFEMIGGAVTGRFGVGSAAYELSLALEELFEMTGLVVLLHGLLHHLLARLGGRPVALVSATAGDREVTAG